MSTRTEIGKIQEISFGSGGYQDAMLGLSVTLGSDKGGWGCGDFKGWWGPDVVRSQHTKWTEADRMNAHAETVMFIGELLQSAKKRTLAELKGCPVEATFENNRLKSWRLLTEAI